MIIARGLCKRFGDVIAVDNLDLTVTQGTVFALLGPNGAGKSTTINMLTTLIQPDRGSVHIAGFDIVHDADAVRRRIGVTFQDLVLDRDLTGRESLDFYGRLYGLATATRQMRTAELLALVELTGAADRLTGTYSGGMRRRLELARCLMMQPQVLFLDEPTQGLDPQHRAMIWQYLRHLQDTQGITIVLTTHAMDEAEALANDVGIIDHGQLIAHGSVDTLISQLGGDVVHMRINSTTADILTPIQSEWIRHWRWSAPDLMIGVDHGARRLPALLDMVRAHGCEIVEVRMQRPSLGDVFLQATGRALRDEVTL